MNSTMVELLNKTLSVYTGLVKRTFDLMAEERSKSNNPNISSDEKERLLKDIRGLLPKIAGFERIIAKEIFNLEEKTLKALFLEYRRTIYRNEITNSFEQFNAIFIKHKPKLLNGYLPNTKTVAKQPVVQDTNSTAEVAKIKEEYLLVKENLSPFKQLICDLGGYIYNFDYFSKLGLGGFAGLIFGGGATVALSMSGITPFVVPIIVIVLSATSVGLAGAGLTYERFMSRSKEFLTAANLKQKYLSAKYSKNFGTEKTLEVANVETPDYQDDITLFDINSNEVEIVDTLDEKFIEGKKRINLIADALSILSNQDKKQREDNLIYFEELIVPKKEEKRTANLIYFEELDSASKSKEQESFESDITFVA